VLHDPLGLRQAEASSGQPRARSHASEDQPELHDALLDELLWLVAGGESRCETEDEIGIDAPVA